MVGISSILLGLCVLCGACGQPIDAQPPKPPVSRPEPRPEPNELGSLSIDELIEKLPRIRTPDDWAPYTDAGREAMDEMRSRFARKQVLTAAQWQRILTKSGALQFPPKWPAGRVYEVTVLDPPWLPLTEITLLPRDRGLRPLRGGCRTSEPCGNGRIRRVYSQKHQKLGTLAVGDNRLEFDVEIRSGGSSKWSKPGPPAGVLFKGPMVFDVEMVAPRDNTLPPARSPELDAAVRRAVGVTACPDGWRGITSPVLVLDADVNAAPELAVTAIAAKVEVLCDGSIKGEFPLMVIRRRDSLRDPESVYEEDVQVFAFVGLVPVPIAALSDSKERARWSIRVTGKPANEREQWNAQRYWAGSVELTLKEALDQERARTAGLPDWKKRVWRP